MQAYVNCTVKIKVEEELEKTLLHKNFLQKGGLHKAVSDKMQNLKVSRDQVFTATKRFGMREH